MRRVLRCFLGLAVAALTGCYSYAAVPLATLATGTDVRARVSAMEAGRLADVLGREDRVLEGRLVGEEDGGLLLQVRGAGSTTGSPLYQRVVLQPQQIQEMEVRRLDRWRTFGLAGALAAGAAYALLQFPLGSGTTGGDGPGTDAAWIPIWPIP